MISYPEPPLKVNIPTPGTEEQALADLAYLWKCDDPDWVTQRESDWLRLIETAFDDYPKVEKNALERYFKYGEKSVYIPVGDFFFLTPYDSKESLLQLFNSSLLNSDDRSLMLSVASLGSTQFENCHWYELHTSLVIETILGPSYREVSDRFSVGDAVVISPSPTLWCSNFVSLAIESLLAQSEWKPFYCCVNYFVTALPYALKEKYRKIIKLPKLLQLAADSLVESALTGRLLMFAQELKDREQEIMQAWEVGEQELAAMKQD